MGYELLKDLHLFLLTVSVPVLPDAKLPEKRLRDVINTQAREAKALLARVREAIEHEPS